jgi:hypothetical protein
MNNTFSPLEGDNDVLTIQQLIYDAITLFWQYPCSESAFSEIY